MAQERLCDTCSGFMAKTQYDFPRCRNMGGSPLTPRRLRSKTKGCCPVWTKAE